jgi:hypothetical protein
MKAARPGGETDIMPRLERDVPGSTPGRGTETNGPVVQLAGHLRDMEKIAGSSPAGITDGGRATRRATGTGRKPVEQAYCLAGSTPAPSAGYEWGLWCNGFACDTVNVAVVGSTPPRPPRSVNRGIVQRQDSGFQVRR